MPKHQVEVQAPVTPDELFSLRHAAKESGTWTIPKAHKKRLRRRGLLQKSGDAFVVTEFGKQFLSLNSRTDVFPTPVTETVAELCAAWRPNATDGWSEVLRQCLDLATRLAGYTGVFQFPLVPIFARSLCRLLAESEQLNPTRISVIEAHVAALRAIVRDHIDGSGGTVSAELARALDLAIAKFNLGSSDVTLTLQQQLAALAAATNSL